MQPHVSWATGLSATVNSLIQGMKDRLPVSGQTNGKAIVGTVIFPCPPELKPRAKQVRWLLDRSTEEGSQDKLLWAHLEETLGPVAERLREVQETCEFYHLPTATAFTKAFNKLLRQKLFSPSSFQVETSECLNITYSLIDDRVLIDLQRAAFAIGVQKSRRRPVQRDHLMEERDKLVYEAAIAGKPYRGIQALVMQKYPSSQNLGHLHVTVSRIFQIATEYAERHGLPNPPPRQRRRS